VYGSVREPVSVPLPALTQTTVLFLVIEDRRRAEGKNTL
jgi:hypothetical protein